MKIVEITNNGIWFEDSYGSECYMKKDDLEWLLNLLKK